MPPVTDVSDLCQYIVTLPILKARLFRLSQFGISACGLGNSAFVCTSFVDTPNISPEQYFHEDGEWQPDSEGWGSLHQELLQHSAVQGMARQWWDWLVTEGQLDRPVLAISPVTPPPDQGGSDNTSTEDVTYTATYTVSSPASALADQGTPQNEAVAAAAAAAEAAAAVAASAHQAAIRAAEQVDALLVTHTPRLQAVQLSLDRTAYGALVVLLRKLLLLGLGLSGIDDDFEYDPYPDWQVDASGYNVMDFAKFSAALVRFLELVCRRASSQSYAGAGEQLLALARVDKLPWQQVIGSLVVTVVTPGAALPGGHHAADAMLMHIGRHQRGDGMTASGTALQLAKQAKWEATFQAKDAASKAAAAAAEAEAVAAAAGCAPPPEEPTAQVEAIAEAESTPAVPLLPVKREPVSRRALPALTPPSVSSYGGRSAAHTPAVLPGMLLHLDCNMAPLQAPPPGGTLRGVRLMSQQGTAWMPRPARGTSFPLQQRPRPPVPALPQAPLLVTRSSQILQRHVPQPPLSRGALSDGSCSSSGQLSKELSGSYAQSFPSLAFRPSKSQGEAMGQGSSSGTGGGTSFMSRQLGARETSRMREAPPAVRSRNGGVQAVGRGGGAPIEGVAGVPVGMSRAPGQAWGQVGEELKAAQVQDGLMVVSVVSPRAVGSSRNTASQLLRARQRNPRSLAQVDLMRGVAVGQVA